MRSLGKKWYGRVHPYEGMPVCMLGHGIVRGVLPAHLFLIARFWMRYSERAPLLTKASEKKNREVPGVACILAPYGNPGIATTR